MPPDSLAPDRGARPPANRLLGVAAPAIARLFNQERARDNAADASAKLQERRHEREEVDAYLRDRHSPIATDTR